MEDTKREPRQTGPPHLGGGGPPNYEEPTTDNREAGHSGCETVGTGGEERSPNEPAEPAGRPAKDQAPPAGAPTEGPREPGAVRPPEEGASHVASSVIGALSGGHVTTIGAVYMDYHIAPDGSGETAGRLSLGHFETWTADRLRVDTSELQADQGQLEKLTAVLAERRILILAGDPELGKTATALLVASRIVARDELLQVSLCRSLGRGVRVELGELAGGKRDYHRRILIFRDAFAWGNADLQRLGTELTTMTVGSYTERLRQSGTYLVFTSEFRQVPNPESLRGLGILQETSGPAPALLTAGFRYQADRLASVHRESAELVEEVRRIVETEGPTLAAKLRSFPRVARFVRDYLLGIAEGRLTSVEALERMDDLKPWLLCDLLEDLDGFCSVLALALCSATPLSLGVSWFRFDDVRRAVTTVLQDELRREATDREARDLYQGDLLVRMRAEAVRSPSEGDMVRFIDDRYPLLLWQVLVGPGKILLTVLRPLLRELLQRDDPFLKRIAAQALGRIGEVDPASITHPLLDEWVRSEEFNHRDLLGHLLQGVLSSRDRSYREGCLMRLRHLALGPDVKVAGRAVVSLRGVGSVDLQPAMAGLRLVLEHRVEIAWAFLGQAEAKLRDYEGNLRPDDMQKAAWEVLAAGFGAHEGAFILSAVQYTLAGLMFAQGDATPVLEGLAEWMIDDPESLAPLVVYLFLHRRGLAYLMQRYKLTLDSEGLDLPMRCDRIVYSLRAGDEAVLTASSFLQRVFRNLDRFPKIFRRVLRDAYLTKLKEWAEEACEVAETRGAVVRLLAGLYDSPNPELNRAIDRLLRGDRDFGGQSRLHQIAVDVLTWSGPSPGGSLLRPATVQE
jgi:hypothetical protein